MTQQEGVILSCYTESKTFVRLVSVTASYDACSSSSVLRMPLTRLRESIFPNVPPYLTFIGPDEKYDDGEEPPEEFVIHYTVAYGTSKTVLECIQRLGARVVEVIWIKNKETLKH